MSTQQDVTPREALMRLGASTAEAIAQVLEMFAPGAVQRGEVTVLPEGGSPFSNVPRGSIASSVSYVDGVTGANIFILAPASARGLATAMGAPTPEEGGPDAELSELEMSAIAEAANQTMAAAAAAIGVVLGDEIGVSTPDIRVLDDPRSAADIYGTAPHATSTTFLIAGEACRLIQLIPAAFVVRMVRAIDELGAERTGPDAAPGGSSAAAGASATDGSPQSLALEEALGSISLRVWAELGRARMPLGSALGLPVGAVLDLDRAADAPVDLYVNGVCFGRGQLLVTEDGEWAVSLEALEHEGLQRLGHKRAGLPEAPSDLGGDSQPLGPQTDEPVETSTSPSVPEPPIASEATGAPDDAESVIASEPTEAPEIPDVKQPEVEGAVT
jgi:flagellar motor switch protein FliN/FliY